MCVGLPLSATVRLLDSQDVLMVLCPLIEKAPWVLKNAAGEVQKSPLDLHTSMGGGQFRHPDFPRTIRKSSKSTLFHGFSMKIDQFQ